MVEAEGIDPTRCNAKGFTDLPVSLTDYASIILEHPGRFELPIKVLQTFALTNLAMGALYGRIGRI